MTVVLVQFAQLRRSHARPECPAAEHQGRGACLVCDPASALLHQRQAV